MRTCKMTVFGKIEIEDNGTTLTRLGFPSPEMPETERPLTPLQERIFTQLAEYFSGKRKAFDIPLEAQGTPFQLQVWEALRAIPYGETVSYQAIAEKVGNPKGCRAVGMANNRNPIAIITPCHRVVGKNGSLVGYAGGLEVKARLLALEQGNTLFI